jgi:hypothetical protein
MSESRDFIDFLEDAISAMEKAEQFISGSLMRISKRMTRQFLL